MHVENKHGDNPSEEDVLILNQNKGLHNEVRVVDLSPRRDKDKTLRGVLTSGMGKRETLHIVITNEMGKHETCVLASPMDWANTEPIVVTSPETEMGNTI